VMQRSKPVAAAVVAVVVMAAEEYDRLKTLERHHAPSFKEHLLSMPKDDGTFERLEAPLRNRGF